DALFGGIFGKKTPVSGVDAGHNRRLILGELLIVGKVAAEIPDAERGDPRGDQHTHHEEAEGELHQELDEPHTAPPLALPGARRYRRDSPAPNLSLRC